MPVSRASIARRSRRQAYRAGAASRFRQRRPMMMIPRPLQTAQRLDKVPHFFKRSWQGVLTLQAAIDSNPYLTGSQFSFQQLPNYTEMLTIFDRYKINGIKFTWFAPSIAQSATEAKQKLYLHHAVDYDDSTAPPNIGRIQGMGTYRTVELTDQFLKNGKATRYWKPKILKEVYRSAVSTGYEPSDYEALDGQYPDIPHYGLKWALQMTDSNGAPITMPADVTIVYEITYYISLFESR